MSTLTYERAKQLYAPYDADQMRHLCALRDIEIERLRDENAKLRELATHALRHIIEFECEADNREQFQGKPCEWCVYHGSSDCPKIIAVMYGELGIEVGDG